MSNSLIPIGDEWERYVTLSKLSFSSGLFPKQIDSPQKAFLIMMKGRELGIPPLQAMEDLMVVDNKVTQSGKLMLARIYQKYPNAQITADVKTETQCAVIASRSKGSKSEVFSFSLDDARRAGLLSKKNWQQYPKNMLYWRVIANVAREMFPDTLMGINYTAEELGAETTEDGEVVDIAAVETPTTAKTSAPGHEQAPNERSREASPPQPKPSDPGRDDPSRDDSARLAFIDGRTEARAVASAQAIATGIPNREAGAEPATLSPVYNGKTAPEKRAFKEMAFKFGIVSKEDLIKVSKECIGLQMDAIPARISELLEMGDFGL